MKYIYFISAAIVVVGVVAYLMVRNRKPLTDINEEVLDGELSFESIVAFMKSLQLDPKSDIPFIGKADCPEFRKMLHAPFPKAKEGYVPLFIGVYNERTDLITHNKLIHAQSLDHKILEILGGENLVVLK